MLYVTSLIRRLADILGIKVFEVKAAEPTNETALERDIESERSERSNDNRSDTGSKSQAMSL